MSYESMEAGLQTLLQGIDGFGADRRNVWLGSIQTINVGVIKAIILEFDGMEHELEAFGGEHLHHWTVRARLYARWRNDAQAVNQLRDDMQSIVNRVDQYPKLNGTTDCRYAHIVDVRPVAEAVEIGGIHFWMREARVRVVEEVSVSEQE